MKRLPNQPTSHLTLFAGIFLKTWSVADAGTMIPQHAHRHPHISLIVSGAVRAWCASEMLGDYVAPAAIKIAADQKHSFLTLTDSVVIACIHAVGEAEDVEITEHHSLELEG
jgi:hypothetical protein